MNLATTYTRAPLSMHAPLVRVEVHLASGLPAMTLVGLPEKAVKESKDRVRAAILNSGFEFPAKHITINLAPAELPKDGARYDLAIALGILAASGQIPPDATAAHEYHGELALSGQLRPVSGILPCALAATDARRDIITAPENHHEAALVAADNTHSAGSLAEIAAILHAGFPKMVQKIYSLAKFEKFFWEKRDLLHEYLAARFTSLEQQAAKKAK